VDEVEDLVSQRFGISFRDDARLDTPMMGGPSESTFRRTCSAARR
jgi:hypothetical protein